MERYKLLLTVIGLSMVLACGNSESETTEAAAEETRIVMEADSLSAELSASSDSVEIKVNELQTLLDSLNN